MGGGGGSRRARAEGDDQPGASQLPGHTSNASVAPTSNSAAPTAAHSRWSRPSTTPSQAGTDPTSFRTVQRLEHGRRMSRTARLRARISTVDPRVSEQWNLPLWPSFRNSASEAA